MNAICCDKSIERNSEMDDLRNMRISADMKTGLEQAIEYEKGNVKAETTTLTVDSEENFKSGDIQMKKSLSSNHTERYAAAGLSFEFLAEITKAIEALQSAGYDPYDQLYGYVVHGNDRYITRFGGAREIVTKMDIKDIRIFLKHYKDHK